VRLLAVVFQVIRCMSVSLLAQAVSAESACMSCDQSTFLSFHVV
jgi:hypothetical protein